MTKGCPQAHCEAAAVMAGPDPTTAEIIAAEIPVVDAPLVQDGINFTGHMVAGAIAGVVEHIAMYPVDTVKTRMQALSHPGQRLHKSSVTAAVQTIIRREGYAGLYRGVAAVAAGAIPSHAMHFATYEMAKDWLGGNQHGHHPMAAAVAGSMATCVNDACMTPADVIKQRLQVAHSPYSGIIDCVKQTMRTDGMGAFFKSYKTTIVMNVPFYAMHFPVYESCKKFLLGAHEDDEGLLVQLVAGGAAGGAAAAITTPLDVVKTRLQTEGVHSSTKYSSSVFLTVRRIWAEEGGQALWRGLKPRILFHVPSAAVCWGTYETMKVLLGVD